MSNVSMHGIGHGRCLQSLVMFCVIVVCSTFSGNPTLQRIQFSSRRPQQQSSRLRRTGGSLCCRAELGDGKGGENSHYQELGISQGAKEDEIRRAYLRLAKQLHPDVSRDPATVARFQRVGEAYSVLSDSAKRRDYDQELLYVRMSRNVQRGFGGTEAQINDDAPISNIVLGGLLLVVVVVYKTVWSVVVNPNKKHR